MKNIWIAFALLAFGLGCKKQAEEKKVEEAPAEAPAPAKVQESYAVRNAKDIKPKAVALVQKLKIDEAPKEVPATQFVLSWAEFLALALSEENSNVNPTGTEIERNFFSYRDIEVFKNMDVAAKEYARYRLQFLTSFGLFKNWSYWIDRDQLRPILKKIVHSAAFRDQAYNWASPHLKAGFREVSNPNRRDYIKILGYMEDRLNDWNQGREEKYLKALEEKTCETKKWRDANFVPPERYNGWTGESCLGLFIHLNHNGKENPLRKVDAFIFRRVKEGWKIASMRSIVGKVLNDLSPLSSAGEPHKKVSAEKTLGGKEGKEKKKGGKRKKK